MALAEAATAARAAYKATAAKDRAKAINAVSDVLGALGDTSQNLTESADAIQTILQKTRATLTEGERRALWSEIAKIRQEAFIFRKKEY